MNIYQDTGSCLGRACWRGGGHALDRHWPHFLLQNLQMSEKPVPPIICHVCCRLIHESLCQTPITMSVIF